MILSKETKKIYTVSKINKYIQKLFNSDPQLNNLTITGEISNFKYHSSGHMYFVLKDDQSQIRCVMFRGSNLGLSFDPRDGLEVRATGDIRVYEKRGEYQFYVFQMSEAGKGALFAAFEALKEKLKNEGFFAKENKKNLPKLPHKIAVITSPTGAAIRDIISITLRRFSNIHIIVVPAQVQGEEAAPQITANIKFLNKNIPDLDFIIIGRGGGSIEELWAFNDEKLAREIYASKIPIISAVGHETDFTISDFVADLRAPTPSGAAEIAIPDKNFLLSHLKLINQKINRIMNHIFDIKKHEYISTIKNLKYQSPKNKILQHFQTIDDFSNRLNTSIKHIIDINENKIKNYKDKIISLSPKSILNRGYSICYKKEGKEIIKDKKQVKDNDLLEIILNRGNISAYVSKKGGDIND